VCSGKYTPTCLRRYQPCHWGRNAKGAEKNERNVMTTMGKNKDNIEARYIKGVKLKAREQKYNFFGGWRKLGRHAEFLYQNIDPCLFSLLLLLSTGFF
jgi:hypothetical protein